MNILLVKSVGLRGHNCKMISMEGKNFEQLLSGMEGGVAFRWLQSVSSLLDASKGHCFSYIAWSLCFSFQCMWDCRAVWWWFVCAEDLQAVEGAEAGKVHASFEEAVGGPDEDNGQRGHFLHAAHALHLHLQVRSYIHYTHCVILVSVSSCCRLYFWKDNLKIPVPLTTVQRHKNFFSFRKDARERDYCFNL